MNSHWSLYGIIHQTVLSFLGNSCQPFIVSKFIRLGSASRILRIIPYMRDYASWWNIVQWRREEMRSRQMLGAQQSRTNFDPAWTRSHGRFGRRFLYLWSQGGRWGDLLGWNWSSTSISGETWGILVERRAFESVSCPKNQQRKDKFQHSQWRWLLWPN